jgi:hypothetical protein
VRSRGITRCLECPDVDANATALFGGGCLVGGDDGAEVIATIASFGIALNLGVDSGNDDLSQTDIHQLVRSPRDTILNSNVSLPSLERPSSSDFTI